MKKESNILGYVIMQIAVCAAEILLALGAIVGILYGACYLIERLSTIVDFGTGLFLLFTLAGAALYIDFSIRDKKADVKREKPEVRPSSCAMVKVYSSR